MAPTVCMTEFPETGKSHKCVRRRQRIQEKNISKKVELKKLSNKKFEIQEITTHPLNSIISRPQCPMDSYVPIILRSSRQVTSSANDNQWKIAMRRDGLVDIFIRTIALVRRNHILQRRVNALREETQNFISSMMNNSGNESENENISHSQNENSQVSSTTENITRSSSSINVKTTKIYSKSLIINDSRSEEKKLNSNSKFTNDSRTDRESINKVSSSSEACHYRT